MYIKTGKKNIEGFSRTCLVHPDPDIRFDAAIQLGGATACIFDQRFALEALTTALQDPCATVQEAALQSLMRMSEKSE